ncbi:hypothetical protein BT69DRAFT_1275317 [Atractiella rhizophila]|nr:hypothetical protein BT69DRAFT_1275317 [Atractiella rhizophila]
MRNSQLLKVLSEHFGMSTKFPKGHLPQHFVDLVAEGGTLDHQLQHMANDPTAH